RKAGKDLGGRPQLISDSQIRSALSLVEGGTPAAQVARDLSMSRATFYRRSKALLGNPIGSTAADTKR
ncbi:MAG: helix-turn-helix domain-containing protein, partial [Kineosporiaceae bacterium]|nr:helix-turn-helix domain-containing protein [Aeromicrobium sp.]